MKPAALILAALLAAPALLCRAADGAWVVTPALTSQYMFRGARLGGPSLQTTLEYDQGGWTAGLWGTVPLKDKVAGQSDPEFDFTGTYTCEIAKDLAVVPGLSVYTYPAAQPADGFYRATFEPSLAVNYTVGAVRFTPKIYYDIVLKGPTAELSAACAVPLPAAGTELDFSATIGTFKWTDYTAQAAPAVKNWGDYWLLGVSAPYQLPNGARISVGWAYTAGSNNYLKQGAAAKVANPAALGRGVFTLSCGWNF